MEKFLFFGPRDSSTPLHCVRNDASRHLTSRPPRLTSERWRYQAKGSRYAQESGNAYPDLWLGGDTPRHRTGSSSGRIWGRILRSYTVPRRIRRLCLCNCRSARNFVCVSVCIRIVTGRSPDDGTGQNPCSGYDRSWSSFHHVRGFLGGARNTDVCVWFASHCACHPVRYLFASRRLRVFSGISNHHPTVVEWEGHKVALRSFVSGRFLFLATENVVSVDGKEVGRSGGFHGTESTISTFPHIRRYRKCPFPQINQKPAIRKFRLASRWFLLSAFCSIRITAPFVIRHAAQLALNR